MCSQRTYNVAPTYSADRYFDIIENMRYEKNIALTIFISWLIRYIAEIRYFKNIGDIEKILMIHLPNMLFCATLNQHNFASRCSNICLSSAGRHLEAWVSALALKFESMLLTKHYCYPSSCFDYFWKTTVSDLKIVPHTRTTKYKQYSFPQQLVHV